MTKRTTWPMRVDGGTQKVGTATVRDEHVTATNWAAKQLEKRTGAKVPDDFDRAADGDPFSIPREVPKRSLVASSVKRAAEDAAEIGRPVALGRAIAGLTRPTAPKRPPGPAGKSKYGNLKCELNGIKFDSKREMMRYVELLSMQGRGEISGLELQVTFVLAGAVIVNGRRRPPLRYIADFAYVKAGEERQTVEDVKGRVTEGYRIKRHLMAARGISIVEVK